MAVVMRMGAPFPPVTGPVTVGTATVVAETASGSWELQTTQGCWLR